MAASRIWPVTRVTDSLRTGKNEAETSTLILLAKMMPKLVPQWGHHSMQEPSTHSCGGDFQVGTGTHSGNPLPQPPISAIAEASTQLFLLPGARLPLVAPW